MAATLTTAYRPTAATLKEEGNACYKAGDFASAVKKYEEALKALPNGPGTAEVEGTRTKCRLNLAQCFLKLCSYPPAEALCDAVLAGEPTSAKALFRRGQARMGRDLLDPALQDLLAACKLDAHNRELRAEYDQLRQLTNAHPTLHGRLQDLLAIESRALRALHSGNADDALRGFELIRRECDSDTIPVQLPHWQARAALGEGFVHRQLGRTTEAKNAFEKALKQSTSDHARAPALAVHATVAHCLVSADEVAVAATPAADGGECVLHKSFDRDESLDRSREQLRSALTAAEALGDNVLIASVLDAMACTFLRGGKAASAATHSEAALRASVECGDVHGQAAGLVTLSAVKRQLGHLSTAGSHAARALTLARALGYPRVEAEALCELCRVRTAAGEPAAGLEYGGEAARLANKHGLRWTEACALAALGAAGLAAATTGLEPVGAALGDAAGAPSSSAGQPSPGPEEALNRAALLAEQLGDSRLWVQLTAARNAVRVQRLAEEEDQLQRSESALEIRKLLTEDMAHARDLGLEEVERCSLGNMGLASLLAGDMMQAFEFLETALGFSNDSNEAYPGKDWDLCNLGLAHIALGNVEQASAHFASAAKVAADQCLPTWRQAFHHGREGMAHLAGGAHREACDALLFALDLLNAEAHVDAGPMLSLAREMHSEQRHADAAPLLEEAFLTARDGQPAPSADSIRHALQHMGHGLTRTAASIS